MDFSKDDLKQAFAEALKESRGGSGIKGDPEAAMASFYRQLEKNKASFGSIASAMISGQRAFKDFSYKIEELSDQIGELEEATSEDAIALRAKLVEQKKELETTQRTNIAKKALIDSVVGTTKAFGNFASQAAGIAGRTLGNFAKGIQDGSSAFAVAGGVMEGVIDTANAGAHAVGGGMQAVGGAMMTARGPVKLLGVAASVAGAAINGLSDAAAATGKFIVNFMVKQLEQTVESFNKLSSSGAMFSNGMTGMYNAARDAGLTIKQLSQVVSQNSETFAASGMGVGEAIKMVGKVGKVMRDTGMDTNLLKLGYSFEEQAVLTAEVMRDLRAANSATLKDPAGIAKATEQYATNLRTIAAITGEDAKKKMEEARQRANQVAFRSRLMELEKTHKGIYQGTITAMSSMSSAMQQAVMEQVVFGGVINEAGSVIMSGSEGFAQGVVGSANAILNGSLATEQGIKENQKLQGQANDVFRTEISKFADIGVAGMTGAFAEINNALKSQIDNSDKISKLGVEQAQARAKEQKEADDALTENVAKAAKTMRDFQLQMQELALSQLPMFSSYTIAILDAMDLALTEFLKSIGKLSGDENRPSMWEAYGLPLLQMIGGAGLFAASSAVDATGIGAVVGLAGNAMGAAYMAQGASGFMSGYQARSRPQGPGGTTVFEGGVRPDYTGVNTSGGQGHGQITPELQKAITKLGEAQNTQNNILAGSRLTSANDSLTFAAHRSTQHGKGRAVDITIPGYTAKKGDTDPNVLRRSDEIKTAIKALGFTKVDDEYINPSPNATSGHFHAELAGGAIVRSNPGGTGVKVGEGGADELVTPLKNGMLPGIDVLARKLDELIRVTRDHKDVSEEMLIANQ